MITRIVAVALVGLVGLVGACGDRRGSRPSARAEPAGSAAAPAGAGTTAATAKPGATALPSLARADWPCRAEGTLPAQGARAERRYDYTDAPRSCLHAPESWLPGCPRAIELVNLDLGLSTTTTLEYDAQGRVTSLRSGDLPGAPITWNADGTIASEGQQRFLQVDARTIAMAFDDGERVARIELDDARRPVRVESLYGEDGKPLSIEQWTYDGPRAATYRVEEHGELKVDLRFIHACE